MITLIGKPEFKAYIIKVMSKYEITPTGKYVVQEFDHPSINIKIYTTGTILLTGSKAKDLYHKLMSLLNEENLLGMDEVGVGDFFGPVVYVSVLFTTETKTYLMNNFVKIQDSKKLKDDEIREIYASLHQKVNHEVEIVYEQNMPQKFGSLEQKSYYHYLNYAKYQAEQIDKTVLDLYTTKNHFFKLQSAGFSNFPATICLETKADSHYYAVALASIFARFYFLIEIEKISKEFGAKIPLGTNKNVKEVAIMLAKEKGIEKLGEVTKKSFKTFNEIKETIK